MGTPSVDSREERRRQRKLEKKKKKECRKLLQLDAKRRGRAGKQVPRTPISHARTRMNESRGHKTTHEQP